MHLPRVQIIVLNYNGREILPKCLPSLAEAARSSRFPTGLTILDNRSTDHSPEWVKGNFPEVRVVTAPKNRFLVSYNDYLKMIPDDIVILLNNDIRVEKNFVDPLVRIFQETPDIFLASPQCFSFDGKKYAGGRSKAEIRGGLFWSSAIFPGYEAQTAKGGYTFASGFGAFNRKRFLALGGYDDLYLPGIMEDADLSFRAWRGGYRSYYVPESRVYHLGQASFEKAFGKKKVMALAHRNAFLFLWKNISDPALLFEHLLLLIPRLLLSLVRGKTEFTLGFFTALPKLGEALKKRAIPKIRARSDREIFRLANGEKIKRCYLFKNRGMRALAGIFDVLGTLLFTWTKPLATTSISPKKILIVRLDSMGDAVLTLPAISELKKKYSESSLDFLVSPPSAELFRLFCPESKVFLFRNNWLSGQGSFKKMIKEAVAFTSELRREKYDLAVDFRGDLRTLFFLALLGIPHRWGRGGTGGAFLLTRQISNIAERHEVLQNLEVVDFNGRAGSPEFPEISVSKEVRNQERKNIVIHIGSGYPSKRWPTVHFFELAKRIEETNLGLPVFIGTETEKRLFESVREIPLREYRDLIGRISFKELLEVLSGADLFIGNDSGPAHLAALLKRKIVLVFSGTNEFRKWAPWSRTLRVLNHPVPCSPCEEKICPLKRHLCMEEISVDEVFKAVEEMLCD